MNAIRRWGPLALAVTATLAATSLPTSPNVGGSLFPPWTDKIGHFALYLWLGWSLGVGLWQGEVPDTGRFLGALAGAAAFAALDEWHQVWIPLRQPAVADWTADLIGAGLGLAASLRLVPGWVRGAELPEQGGGRRHARHRRAGGERPGDARSSDGIAADGRSASREVVDIHTHLMPEVDDGARDARAAGRAAAALADHGVAAAVATPHLDASTLSAADERSARLSELDRGWERLRKAVTAHVTLHRGAEIRLDAPVPDLGDERVRLAGGDAVLVEFGTLEVPPHGDRQLAEITGEGWLPVLAHPERYRGVADQPEVLEKWRSAGAALLVNCGSLVGQYGRQAREVAWYMLESGQADAVATDWHTRGPVPLEAAMSALHEREVGGQGRILLETNPRRLLDGRRPAPVPPVPAADRGVWRRLLSLFGR